ncbi:hypothetical protein [Sulfitobacter aestuariivivens]|uniref:Uncharacterized protein n=1 Tax=Sulfitobacter aestuariivivens TaxID=2766981 RepID=A0A927D465_9RHOB|nr:hypothetical protein [Sulfitobacter aestuariivivens]MBD3662521.1 hypothetical protein [Sulfitobacter aestuariivivens]
MKHSIFLISALALLAAPLSAQSLRVENRINVSAVAGGFSVATGGGFGARGMWCGAGEYAARVQGASGTTRVYVAQPRTSANRDAVVFTTDPAGLTPVRVFSVGASIRDAGANLSVDHARSFCHDFRLSSGR